MPAELRSLTQYSLGRYVAILSLSVIVFGKPVHWHQECGCCHAHHSGHHCHHGCQHATPAEGGSRPATSHHSPTHAPHSSHDSRQCAVCQQLAESPDLAVVVVVPALSSCLRTVDECGQSASAMFEQQPAMRGPPCSSQSRGV